MLFFLSSGDIIIYEDNDFIINVGDIVIYESNNSKIAHRVLYIIEDNIVLAGDNCRKFENVNINLIIGKVIIIIKNNIRFNVAINNSYREQLVEYLREFILLNDKYIDFVLLEKYGLEYNKCLQLYKVRNQKQQKYLESVEIKNVK